MRRRQSGTGTAGDAAGVILTRYLVGEISKPLIAVLVILVVLFGSFSGARFLSDAVNGLLPTDTILQLVGLKALISLEVLIPISLYLAVVLALGRLYSESEISAMFALGVTPGWVMRVVLMVSALLAVGVAFLSLNLRPWAYQRLHQLSSEAQASLNVSNMEAGTFYESDDGDRVIFIGRRAGPDAPARDVFVQFRARGRRQIVHADQAVPMPDTSQQHSSTIDFSDAKIYDIARHPGEDDRIAHARHMRVNLTPAATTQPGYSALSASSAQLASSNDAGDIAEFQWRLSTSLSTLLLGLLGVPLSRSQPRQGKYAKMGTAILIYAAYYLLSTSARTWVEQGAVAAFPGIWWTPALLALVLLVAVSTPGLRFRLGR